VTNPVSLPEIWKKNCPLPRFFINNPIIDDILSRLLRTSLNKPIKGKTIKFFPGQMSQLRSQWNVQAPLMGYSLSTYLLVKRPLRSSMGKI